MAQDQAVLDCPAPTPIRRSLSDRPVLVRWSVHLGRFFRTKPLGGIGVVIIALCVFAGLFGGLLDRYDPETIFSQVNPAFDEELYEKSLTDPDYPAHRTPGTAAEGRNPSALHGPVQQALAGHRRPLGVTLTRASSTAPPRRCTWASAPR